MEVKEVAQILNLIDVGVTFPVRCRFTDNTIGIVKYQKNPTGTVALINEFVGNSIASIIDLTIPDFGICNLSEECIFNSNIEELGPENSGLAFYSKYIGSTTPVNANLLKHASNKETERLLLFDQLIENEDRHTGNLIAEINSERKVFFIDCSHIMTNNGNLNGSLDINRELNKRMMINAHLFEKTSQTSKKNVYAMLCEYMGYDENRLFAEKDRIRSKLDKKVLAWIKNDIPQEWITPDIRKRVSDMFTILEARLERIDDICGQIAEERRSQI